MNNKPENDNSVDAVSTVDNSGNAAAMREALKKCLLYIACVESVGIGTIKINDKVKLNPKKIIKLATEALAAPPRNCDVGTAEEQEMRFDAFCKGINGCRDCIIHIRRQNHYCHSAWAQMPYEQEGGAK